MKKFFTFTLIVLSVAACSHHRDVRPGAKGVHTVIVQSDTKSGGAEYALDQAEDFCDDQDKRHYIISEKVHYEGSMDEESYRSSKSLANAAKVGGTAANIFGGHRESNLGGIAAVGGIAGDAYLGDPYRVKMTFKCK